MSRNTESTGVETSQNREENEQPANGTKTTTFVWFCIDALLWSSLLWVGKHILRQLSPRTKSWAHVKHYLLFILVIFSGDCDFESGMCTYDNTQAEDQFDWLRNAGTTPSLRTGPSVDHTLGTGFGNSNIRNWCFCLTSRGNREELIIRVQSFLGPNQVVSRSISSGFISLPTQHHSSFRNQTVMPYN